MDLKFNYVVLCSDARVFAGLLLCQAKYLCSGQFMGLSVTSLGLSFHFVQVIGEIADQGEGFSLQANQILGLAPGEVFVQRNVGNLATHKDMNAMACLEFAVDVLKVILSLHVSPCVSLWHVEHFKPSVWKSRVVS